MINVNKSRKYHLKRHIESIHGKDHLKRHIESIHGKVTFSCDQCEYKMDQKGNLKIRIDSTHENNKDFGTDF